MKDHPVERHYRYARVAEIYGEPARCNVSQRDERLIVSGVSCGSWRRIRAGSEAPGRWSVGLCATEGSGLS